MEFWVKLHHVSKICPIQTSWELHPEQLLAKLVAMLHVDIPAPWMKPAAIEFHPGMVCTVNKKKILIEVKHKHCHKITMEKGR